MVVAWMAVALCWWVGGLWGSARLWEFSPSVSPLTYVNHVHGHTPFFLSILIMP